MDDTDRLIAGLFAATMTARLSIAKVSDFWAFYDSCTKTILERGAKTRFDAEQHNRDAWDKL
jgi:hypothetical protein